MRRVSRPVVLLSATALCAVTACSSSDGTSASSPPAPTTAASTSRPPVATSSSASSSATTSATTSAPATTRPSTRTATAAPTTRTRAPAPPQPAPRGSVVVLNPGHNGGNASHTGYIDQQVPAGYGERKACDTTGTSTNAGYAEHAFTWDVSLRTRRILQAAGVTVVMTRPNDIGVGPCVNERAAVGNRTNVAAVVSIHADGAPASGHGFHVNQDSRRPDGASRRVAQESVALGRAVHKTLVAGSGLTPSNYIGDDGYYFRSDLAGLNLARRPTTFLELGNMRNADDAALLSSKSGRARIASAVAAGILAFLRQR
ncbi:N-acetylmuramoyl-L-alanine amidase [Jatrophihabitans endophyticus]|uniref:N-acetylmuramoyl-L-alanine amidase n=1 Tax=Jatrophihabitans endophyticus TaxID=1206085 RepID=A0A1M5H6F0_9ACTN|nr:N-acetylmuramoyl-L-alanine amidase [Jatrophihabitans endophyticus]SHG11478.1 N-acetylmuramoyl-L-alanine amidase [Jatrophihabitans endophyticus]